MKQIEERINRQKFSENSKKLLENSEFFDTGFYKKQNPKLRNTNCSDDEILENYLENNKDEKFPPSKFFNTKWYIDHNPDVEKIELDPLIHFIKFGQQEGRLYRYTPVDFKGLGLFDKRNNLYEMYKTIYHSDIFDIDYYLKNNGRFDLEGYDPIIHYILIGAEQGYNPSRKFNTAKYMEKMNSFSDLNPLYYYLKYENTSNKKFTETYLEQFNKHNKFQVETVDNILSHLKRKVSIIIPIYNAYEETCDCIRSVLLNTHIDYELILINDCSTDERIKPLLDSLKDIENIKVINNKENQGFVKNVNRGIREAGSNDVVLLNSDTIVTPRWLSKIITAAYNDSSIATVTPLSNNSDISAVNLGINKDQQALNKNAYKLEKLDYDSYFEAPTGNGFCLFIKREALDELGLFDTIFKRGYGEETDFTSRAREAGWKNIRALDTFIYHRRHASFTKEKTDKLKEENKKINMERHPDVFKLWDDFEKQPRIKEILRKTENIQYLNNKSERILYVTEFDHNRNLKITSEFYKISQKYDTHILSIDDNGIYLYIYDEVFGFIEIYSDELMNKSDDEVRRIYFNLISTLRYNLFYIRQVDHYASFNFIKTSEFVKLSIPLEIPVIYEGDYYYTNLMDEINEKLNPQKSLDELIDDKSNCFNFKDKKVVIYTAITGGYDDLVTPSVVDENFDYVCFTDNPDLKSDFWEIKLMNDKEDSDLDEIRKARKYKILPHKYLDEYDYSIWIDGCFDIVADIKRYVKEYSKNHKLLAIDHDLRNCIYDEARACIKAGHDSVEIITNQMNKYKHEGFPKSYGLIASGILFRDHHDPEVIKLMEDWFNEVKNYSRRDQLSFNYVCWKNNFQYDGCNLYYFKNHYFFRFSHPLQDIKYKGIRYHGIIKDQILSNMQNTTTIIIPIYNRYEDTLKCINSIIKYTNVPYELLLIDNGSTDKRINRMLLEFREKYDNIHIITNNKHENFSKCVNIGLDFSDNDIVLLKSSSIVTPKWLSKIKYTAYENIKVGSVTPLTGNIQKFQVLTNKINDISNKIGLTNTVNIIEKLDSDILNIPIINNSCIFIKWRVIDKVGHFDLGFKNENEAEEDFIIRQINAGYNNVIDTKTYIYNNNEDKPPYQGKHEDNNHIYFDMKHPDYKVVVDEFFNNSEYEKILDNIVNTLDDESIIENNKKNILYVTYEDMDGNIHITDKLIENICDENNIYILTATETFIKLYGLKSNTQCCEVETEDEFQKNLSELFNWEIKPNNTMKNIFSAEFEQIYFNILVALNTDIVYSENLIYHSLNVPKITKMMGIKLILIFSDFYYIYPSNTQIEEDQFTQNISIIDKIKKQCFIEGEIEDLSEFKDYIDKWHVNISNMFEYIDEFIILSQNMYDIYTEFYPEVSDKPYHIM